MQNPHLMSSVPLSLEVSLNEKAVLALEHHRLSSFDFISTFFPNASDHFESLKRLSSLDYQLMPHIAAKKTTPKILRATLKRYASLGIQKLLIIGGDGEIAPNAFADSVSLLRWLKHHSPEFTTYVAVDVSRAGQHELLLEKYEAGADAAITQFFFDASLYQIFCESLTIPMPIIPGVMPYHSPEKLNRICERCRIKVPSLIADESQRVSATKHFCQTLISMGAPALHFFSLNEFDFIEKVIGNEK